MFCSLHLFDAGGEAMMQSHNTYFCGKNKEINVEICHFNPIVCYIYMSFEVTETISRHDMDM